MLFVVVASCVALFLHGVNYPPCAGCDSVRYGLDASVVQRHGLAVRMPSNGLRTYGYPVFLSIVFAGYHWDAAWGIFSPRVAIAQTALYLAACLTLFFAVLPVNRTFAWCVASGLMCNPFVLNYVPLRLTEGLTASMAVFLAASAVLLCRSSSTGRFARILFGGSLLAGFAMMVRPANLSLFAAWGVLVVCLLWRNKNDWKVICIAAGAGMLLPLLPQMAINYFFYDTIGFLPTRGLGPSTSMSQYQTLLGLKNLKYATVVLPDRSAVKVFYPNPMFRDQDIAQYGIWIYVHQPLRGAATALAHLFQSVNHDYFFTYIHNRNAWLGAPINFVGHVTIFAAGTAAVGWTVAATRERRVDCAAIFTLMVVVVTVLTNSVAIVETRFGMLIYLVAGPLAIWGMVTLRTAPNLYRVTLIAACLVYGLGATALSFAMLPGAST